MLHFAHIRMSSSIWNRLPEELWGLIEDHIVGEAPDLLPCDRPPFYPLQYPYVAWREKTNLFALARTSRAWFHRIMSRAWRHVVITKPSHMTALLAPDTLAAATGLYERTLRCDIMLPLGSSYGKVWSLLARFPHVQAVALECPSLQCFAHPSGALAPSITSLQVGLLPRGFGSNHILNLSTSFPRLKELQVVHCPSVTLPDILQQTSTERLLPCLHRLAVGCPWQFLFDEPAYRNHFLRLLAPFSYGTIFSTSIAIAIKLSAAGVSDFLRVHGRRISELACSSNSQEVLGPALLRDCCPSLTTIILTVDSDTTIMPAWPDTLADVVVLLPFVRRWREIPSLSGFLVRCLERVVGDTRAPAHTLHCELRGTLTEPWLNRRIDRLDASAPRIVTFRFRE